MSVLLGSAYGKVIIDASGVRKGLSEASGLLGGFGNTMMGIGDQMGAAGRNLTTKVTLPLVGMGAAAAKVAGDFEGQMNVLTLAARDSGTGLDDLRQAALLAGADTQLVGISAAEAAEAMTNFYRAGLDTTAVFGDLNAYLESGTDLTGALRAAVDLAAGSDLELAQASEAVAIAMATFGLNAEDATYIADSFVQSADASVTEVGELTQALVNVGLTAVDSGWSLGETNTALALLSERGLRGAEAGTALKRMMMNLTRPTKDVVGTLQELGVELYNADGTMKSLPNIIGQLEGSMAGLTDQQRTLAVITLAGSDGQRAMNTLLGEGTEGWSNMESAVMAAATAQEAGAARTEGFNAAMENLMGVVETFLITVGTPLIEDFLTPLAQKLSEAMGWLLEQDPAWVKVALAIGGVLAVAGPLLMGLGAMASGIGVVVSIAGALSGVLAAVGGAIVAALGPVLLIVAAVAAVAALLYLAWETNFLGIRDIVAEVWGALQETFEAIKQVVTDVMSFLRGEMTLDDLKEKVSTSLAGIGEAWRTAWTRIQEIAGQVWTGITEVVGRAMELLKSIIVEKVAEFISPLVGGMDEARQVITDAWQNVQDFLSGVWDHIVLTAQTAWEGLKTLVGEAVEGLRTIVAAVMLVLSGDWAGAWETIKGTVAGVWETIVGAVSTAVNKVVEVVTTAWDAIKGVWAKLKGEEETGQITDPEQAAEQAAIWQQMVNDLTLAWQAMQTKVVEIANAVAAFLDGWGARVQNAVVSAIASMRDEVVRLVQDMAASVRSTLNSLEGSARSAGEAIGQALADGLRSQVGEVRAAAEALADAVDSYLPGSDARVGPLSDLMASGMALPETLARGIDAGLGTLVRAAQEMAAAVAMQGGGMAPMMPAMAGAGAAGRADNASYGTQVTAPVTVYATVTNEVDVERLAHRIADVQEWRRRG